MNTKSSIEIIDVPNEKNDNLHNNEIGFANNCQKESSLSLKERNDDKQIDNFRKEHEIVSKLQDSFQERLGDNLQVESKDKIGDNLGEKSNILQSDSTSVNSNKSITIKDSSSCNSGIEHRRNHVCLCNDSSSGKLHGEKQDLQEGSLIRSESEMESNEKIVNKASTSIAIENEDILTEKEKELLRLAKIQIISISDIASLKRRIAEYISELEGTNEGDDASLKGDRQAKWNFLKQIVEIDPQCYNWCFSEFYTLLFIQIHNHIRRHKKIKYNEILWFLSSAPSTTIVRTCFHFLVSENADSYMRNIARRDLGMLCTTRNDAVYSLFHVVLSDPREGNLSQDEEMSRWDMISNRILDYSYLYSTVKSKCTAEEAREMHLKRVIDQSIYIMRNLEEKKSPHTLHAVASLCGKIITRFPDIGQKYIIKELLKPFAPFLYFEADRIYHKASEGMTKSDIENRLKEYHLPPLVEWKNELLLSSEKEVTASIDAIYRIYFSNISNPSIIASIKQYIPIIIHLLSFLRGSKLLLRQQSLDIISRFFRVMSKDAIETLKKLVSYNPNHKIRKWSPRFHYGETAGVDIKLHKGDFFSVETISETIVEVLKEVDSDQLLGEFLLHLVSHFTVMKDKSAQFGKRGLLVLSTLTHILETFNERLITNTRNTLQLIKLLLLTDGDDPKTFGEYSQIGIALLTSLLQEVQFLDLECKSSLKDVDDILAERMKNSLRNENSEELRMLGQLRNEVTTRLQEDKRTTSSEKSEDEIRIELNAAIKDIKDTNPGVQASGLRKLRQFILDKNPLIQKNVKKTLEILKKSIEDEDDFVYNFAIQGLSAMGDVFPDEVIPLLCAQYRDKTRHISFRIKVGEALLLVMRRCGEILPKYAPQFISTFLECCKEESKSDPEIAALVRSSSVSNIATSGEILRFGIYPFITDILDVVEYIIMKDEDIEVQLAAIYVIHRMLQGFKAQIFTTDTDIKKLRSILTIAQNSQIESVRYNARSTEMYLDELWMEHLQPKY